MPQIKTLRRLPAELGPEAAAGVASAARYRAFDLAQLGLNVRLERAGDACSELHASYALSFLLMNAIVARIAGAHDHRPPEALAQNQKRRRHGANSRCQRFNRVHLDIPAAVAALISAPEPAKGWAVGLGDGATTPSGPTNHIVPPATSNGPIIQVATSGGNSARRPVVSGASVM